MGYLGTWILLIPDSSPEQVQWLHWSAWAQAGAALPLTPTPGYSSSVLTVSLDVDVELRHLPWVAFGFQAGSLEVGALHTKFGSSVDVRI